jgi:hypothetical protein
MWLKLVLGLEMMRLGDGRGLDLWPGLERYRLRPCIRIRIRNLLWRVAHENRRESPHHPQQTDNSYGGSVVHYSTMTFLVFWLFDVVR